VTSSNDLASQRAAVGQAVKLVVFLLVLTVLGLCLSQAGPHSPLVFVFAVAFDVLLLCLLGLGVWYVVLSRRRRARP